MADMVLQSDTSIQDDVEVVRIEELRDKILALDSSDEEHIIELRELRVLMKRWIESLPEEEDGISPAKRGLIQRDNNPLLDYLSNLLRDSNEELLRFEAAYLLFQISTDPAFVAELPSHVYDVLISAMGSAEEAIRSQTIDVILDTTKENERSHLNRVKLGRLMSRNFIAVMLNRVQNASDPLAVKACQLLERISIKKDYFFPPLLKYLPFLASCLHSSKNSVIAAAAEAFSTCTDGPNTYIEVVLSGESVPTRLAELLLTPVEHILHPVLRTVGNIITGEDSQTQMMIDLGVVSNLLWLLDYPNKKISREACWTISNISAGSQSQIQEVINAAIVPKVIVLLKTATEEDLQNYAALTISNILFGGTTEQVDYVISEGGIEAVCDVWKGLDHGKGAKIERPLRDCFDSLVKSAGNYQVERRERIRERMASKMVDGSTDKELWPTDALRFAQQEDQFGHEEAEDVSEVMCEEDEDIIEPSNVTLNEGNDY